MQRKNSIFIISAPSGAGKSSLIQLLLAQNTNLCFSISHTTRPPRTGEIDGVEYFFISEEQFHEMIRKDELLEWAQVHGYYYGTSRGMPEKAQTLGKDLILDIDVQGATRVKEILPEAISIFVLPPSYDVLYQRLVQRKKDTEQQIAKRMENARQEIALCHQYDYIVINTDLQTAFEDLNCILQSQRCRRENMLEQIREILHSFQR
jgi:guanylate kinase